MKQKEKKTETKRSGVSKIILLACAGVVYSAILSNLVNMSATELVVNAASIEVPMPSISLEAVVQPADEKTVLLDQEFPVFYLNTETDLLESDAMLAASDGSIGKRTPVFVMEEEDGLAKVMTEESTVGYVRLSALSKSLGEIFDSCSETKYIAADTVLKSGPDAEAADAGPIAFNEEVEVTGWNDETYWRISYNGSTAYIDKNSLMDEKYVEPEPEPEPVRNTSEPIANPAWDGSVLTRSAGVVYGPSGKETYYNLNMSGVVSILQGMGVSGDYWVRDDGVKMYGDYVIAACAFDIRPRGSLVETSLGTAICADTGGFAVNNPTQVDIAVNW